MAESTLGKVKNDLMESPAADRLKDELRNYARVRVEHTVSRLGDRLGEGVTKLGESGGGVSGPLKSLSKGGEALSEGESPAQAVVKAGASQLAETVKDKARSLFGQGRKSGDGKSKSVLIVEDIDVGVPVREAYDQWTQFQEFSTFAKGAVSVEKTDDTTSNWKVKVAKSTRSWQANVTEQVPDERITWTTEGAKGTVKGVVTFHALTDNLTRVLLVLEYFPKGLFEKTGNMWRAQGRRARLDLKSYRKFLMLRGEATDGWRGEIRDGEVVVDHEQALTQERDEEAEASSEGGAGESREEEYEAEAGEHDEFADEFAYEDDDGEDGDEGDDGDGEYDDAEYDDAEYGDEADEHAEAAQPARR